MVLFDRKVRPTNLSFVEGASNVKFSLPVEILRVVCAVISARIDPSTEKSIK